MHCLNRFLGVSAGAGKEVLLNTGAEYVGITARGCAARTNSWVCLLASTMTSS